MRRDFQNPTFIPCFSCDLSGFHFFDCLLYCTLFSVVEYTFAVRLWGFDYAIRREAHIFWSRYCLYLFLIGRSLWWVIQWWEDWGRGLYYTLMSFFHLYFLHSWTSSRCVIGVEKLVFFSPRFFSFPL